MLIQDTKINSPVYYHIPPQEFSFLWRTPSWVIADFYTWKYIIIYRRTHTWSTHKKNTNTYSLGVLIFKNL